MQAGKNLPFFFVSWAEMKGRGRDPAGGACVPSFLPTHGCPVPRLLLLAPLSLPDSPFPSGLGLCACNAAAASWAAAMQVCAGRCPASPGMAAGSEPPGCCEEGPRCLLRSLSPSPGAVPLQRPSPAHVPLEHACWSAGDALVVYVPPLPCFPSGLVAFSPVAAQAEVTRAVLSARTFRTSAGGWLGLGSRLAQTVGARFWVPVCRAVVGPLLSRCKTCGCMGTRWLVGKCGLANGLRCAAGGVDATRPPAPPLHQLSPGCARKPGRPPRPARVRCRGEAGAGWLSVLCRESPVRPSHSQTFSLNKPGIENKPGESGVLLFVYVCLCAGIFQVEMALKKETKEETINNCLLVDSKIWANV